MATIPFNAPLREDLVRYLIRALGNRMPGMGMGGGMGMGMGMGQGMGQMAPQLPMGPAAPDSGLRELLARVQGSQAQYPSLGLQSEMLARGRETREGIGQPKGPITRGRGLGGPTASNFGYDIGGTGNAPQYARFMRGMADAAKSTPGGMSPLPEAVGPMFPSPSEAMAFASALGAVRPNKAPVAAAFNQAQGEVAGQQERGRALRDVAGINAASAEKVAGIESQGMLDAAVAAARLAAGLNPDGTPMAGTEVGTPGETDAEAEARIQKQIEQALSRLNEINPPRNVQKDATTPYSLIDLLEYILRGGKGSPIAGLNRERSNLNRLNKINPPRNIGYR